MGEIILIAAVARNGVIGKDGDIPWPPYKGDLPRFKRLTRNHGVIMGRVTAKELQEKKAFPLPERKNIVLTSRKDYGGVWGENVISMNNLQYAIGLGQRVNLDGRVYVIGGERVYRDTIGLADKLEITEIPLDIEGDRFFPKIGDEWEEVFRDNREQGHSYVTYEKKK
jgi:dihydrofolate reductase